MPNASYRTRAFLWFNNISCDVAQEHHQRSVNLDHIFIRPKMRHLMRRINFSSFPDMYTQEKILMLGLTSGRLTSPRFAWPIYFYWREARRINLLFLWWGKEVLETNRKTKAPNEWRGKGCHGLLFLSEQTGFISITLHSFTKLMLSLEKSLKILHRAWGKSVSIHSFIWVW